MLLAVAGIYLAVQIKWIRDRHAFLTQLERSRCGLAYSEMGGAAYSPDQQAPWPIRLLGEYGIGFIVFFRPNEPLNFREGAAFGKRISANNYLDGEVRRQAVERARRLFPEAGVNR